MSRISLPVYDQAAVSDETIALNADIVARLKKLPDKWAFPPAEVRRARLEGKGPFPLLPPDPHAKALEIEGPHGPIPLRIIRPSSSPCRGVYLHIHGGGWVLGTAAENDDGNRRIAETCSFAVVSVDYRLAPEHPYPQGPDDCETVALWLAQEMEALFGTSHLTIGGESAGAHLSVVTMLRLRDKHGLTPFKAANLIAGCYDLGLTPSVRNWGDEPLIINTRDVEHFVDHFLGSDIRTDNPDISPLYARLEGLPPALFSVGTRDLLLDDSLFIAQRWQAAGLSSQLAVFPGGCHVFQTFESALSHESRTLSDDFLKQSLER